jgi:hypothetical protein
MSGPDKGVALSEGASRRWKWQGCGQSIAGYWWSNDGEVKHAHTHKIVMIRCHHVQTTRGRAMDPWSRSSRVYDGACPCATSTEGVKTDDPRGEGKGENGVSDAAWRFEAMVGEQYGRPQGSTCKR